MENKILELKPAAIWKHFYAGNYRFHRKFREKIGS